MAVMTAKRIFYDRPFATSHTTKWYRREANVIALAESVAFPEGGGQLPDLGVIRQNGKVTRFTDAQKRLCRQAFVKGFPPVQVDGEIQLTLESDLGPDWDERIPIEVAIDAERRAKLTRSHTAAHLVYIGLLDAIPRAREGVCGCLIEPEGGRFDLRIEERITPEQVSAIARTARFWQQADYDVITEAYPDEPDCRIWVSNGVRIPCGGCHLPRTGPVGEIQVQRRSKGKSMERVYYTLVSPLPSEILHLYMTHKVGEIV